MNLRRIVHLALFTLIGSNIQAQAVQSQQNKLFRLIPDTLVLDSLSLMPGSIHFVLYSKNDTLPSPEINYKKHALIFKDQKPDSIRVSYTRLPYNLEKVYYHKDQNILYRDYSRNNPYTISYNDASNQNNLFLNDGLTKNGNISRGISFGNNQDVVVNSNLNLQVNGKLSQDVDIMMAATDNNIPFQADGTTAQLQEFDKVFIQLNTSANKLVVGDYQLSRPQSPYFMNFYKRAQGAYLENTYKDTSGKKPLIFKTQFAGAVSKGKFSRQVFFGTENNQGPYRLKGADNEPFIIVLSGTEKIYIDGRPLQRGQENDYIIDYNTGEITFTAKQQITKDKRIVAEFQYAERNYARSLFFFGEEIQSKRGKFYFDAYSEQDNKNRPLQQSLSQGQKNVMIDAGDSIQNAYYSGAQQEAFNTRDVFYRKTDSVVGSLVYSNVYVYTQVQDSVNYTLRFSYVGQGKGNYNLLSTAANGRVYKWVAPLDGVLQGSYEPVVPLVTPKQNQMILAGFSHSITENNTLNMEGVYTKYDINRFSSADKGNDEGTGLKVISKNQNILKNDSLQNTTKLIYNINYEFLQKQFVQIERFRTVEFDRDWNRPLTGKLLGDQNVLSTELGIVSSKGRGFTYGSGYFNEGTNYKGLRNSVTAAYTIGKCVANYNGSYLSTNDTTQKQNTEFYRHKILLAQTIQKLRFAYADEFEHNLFMNDKSGALLPRAYQWWDWEGSVSNADSGKTKTKVFYKERRDKLTYDGQLKDSTFAANYGIRINSYAIKNNPFTILVTYRKLELSKNIRGTSLKPDNTLLNRFEYNPRYLKGCITSNLFYETGYGLENKKEYYYLEVAPGQGQYTWKDYNGNTIKELNEFETAQFIDQANYIRIYTPTNDYVKVLQNQFSISLSIRPSVLIKNAKGAGAKFASFWGFQTAIRLDNKITNKDGLNTLNPFYTVADSFLLSSGNNIRQSVFFNQSSAVFGADYTYISNRSKQLLTNGLENKIIQSHQVRWRYNFASAWAIYNDNILSEKGNSSQFFSSRDYKIQAYENDLTLSFQPNTKFRLNGIYKYNTKYNALNNSANQSEPTHQSALINTMALELRYNQTEKGSLTGRCDFIKIEYNDITNSSIAYEMMNGLNPGDNYTWELVYQRNLNNNIQISFNYNGRKSTGSKVINIGGAQIRAFF